MRELHAKALDQLIVILIVYKNSMSLFSSRFVKGHSQ